MSPAWWWLGPLAGVLVVVGWTAWRVLWGPVFQALRYPEPPRGSSVLALPAHLTATILGHDAGELLVRFENPGNRVVWAIRPAPDWDFRLDPRGLESLPPVGRKGRPVEWMTRLREPSRDVWIRLRCVDDQRHTTYFALHFLQLSDQHWTSAPEQTIRRAE